MDYDKRYRVYNRCKYTIGVKLLSGATLTIPANSFQIIDANNILYIESICSRKKFFSSKMLVAVDDNGKDLPIEYFGMAADEYTAAHFSDDEIKAAIKQTPKKLEAWLANIDDPVELDAVYKVALTLDLPASKLKVLSEKIPDKDWIK